MKEVYMKDENRPVIILDEEWKLRIYAFPLRQKILRLMKIIGTPVTSKKIADKLSISPSSARHHLMKLRELGLVEHDHYEMINGIRADYLRPAVVTVSFSDKGDEALLNDKEQTIRQMIGEGVNRFFESLPARRRAKQASPESFQGDILSGIVHLDDTDAKEFYTMVRGFLDSREKSEGEGSSPWEFSFLFYRSEEEQQS